MVEAATEFRKSGFSDEDAANLALVATMYQNVADESISAADSAGFIIAQMKAFNIEAEDATHIIDAVNEVSNRYAVSSSDLANNLGKVSSALAVGGNSFEETLGMMTAITEITRNSSTAARGLVSIQSRFNQIIDETSSTGQKLTAFYDKHGIAIKDQDGQLRNLYDVLKDTAGIWDTLDENEQKYFLNIQAGANQTRNLAALMENFGVAVSATATAMGAAGSAAEENGRVMESLQKKIDNLRDAWENFSNNTITKDFIGGILDAGTQLLTFANTDLGQATVKALLFGTTIGSATGFIGTFVGKIFELATEMKKLGSVADGPTTAIGKFLAIGTKGKWTLIALGIAGITAVVIALSGAFKDAEERIDKFISKAQESSDNAGKLTDSQDKARESLEKLLEVPPSKRTDEIDKEIERLEAEIETYDRLIAKEQERAEKAGAKAGKLIEREGFSTGKVSVGADGSQVSFVGTPYEDLASRLSDVYGKDYAKVHEALTATYTSEEQAIYALSRALEINTIDAQGNQKSIEELRKNLSSYGIDISSVNVDIEESTQQFRELNNSLRDSSGYTDENLEATKRLIDANAEQAEKLRELKDTYGGLTDEQAAWLNEYDLAVKRYQDGQRAVQLYSEATKIMGDLTDGMPSKFSNSESALMSFAQSLMQNSSLGISSISDLKATLQQLADAGIINLDAVGGDIDALIQKMIGLGMIEIPDKTVDITADNADAIQGLDEVIDAASEVPPQIISEISTASDADTMVASLDNLNAAIDRLQGKSVDVTIGAKTDSAISALNGLKSQIEGTVTDVDVNAVGNDMATPMLNQINSLAAAIPRNISVAVVANTSQAIAALNRVASYSIPGKSFAVTCTDFASSTINAISIKLANLRDKTVTVTVNYVTKGNPPAATGREYTDGGPYLVNDGAPVNGSSGELIVSDGIGTIYNGGEETVVAPPRGSKIYNAADTQNILKERGLTVEDLDGVGIPAMANGTTNNKYPDYRLDPTYSGVTTLKGSGEDLKKNFDEWLKEKKHFLNMDVITEAQYYRDLEIMNERYLKNMADYRDDYWQHEEEIYNWRNQSLEEQIALEEKLEELAKAKTQKVLTYTGGRFQYLQNIEAIAAAQREVDKITGKYADGTMSARGGLSLVGERGPELRVLKNGDGIIPADATKNLLSLSRFSAKDIVSAAKSNITQYAFSISNISLPNVQSPEDFIDGLRNMAYQYSFTRT